jgi:uncharacterized protein YpmB
MMIRIMTIIIIIMIVIIIIIIIDPEHRLQEAEHRLQEARAEAVRRLPAAEDLGAGGGLPGSSARPGIYNLIQYVFQ